MRCRVFKDRVNCDVQANESLEIDQYGALHHTYLLLHSGDGAITGCVRLSPTTSPTMFGAELEASYELLPGLKLHSAGGYEATKIDNGQSAVDLMDRTAGNPN